MSKLTKTGKRCTIRLTELEELVVSLSIPGSARHSHCRGQGFDSPMLHKNWQDSMSCHIFVAWASHPLTEDNATHWRGKAACDLRWRKSRRRLSQQTGSELRSAESRPCLLRNRGSTFRRLKGRNSLQGNLLPFA